MLYEKVFSWCALTLAGEISIRCLQRPAGNMLSASLVMGVCYFNYLLISFEPACHTSVCAYINKVRARRGSLPRHFIAHQARGI
jgi:hypothetical protein